MPLPPAPRQDKEITSHVWQEWFRQVWDLTRQLTSTTSTTIGAAGGAAALPATPVGYITIVINNTNYKVPYYNV